jgi:predicted MPP superfamily phosphohydrolase
MESINQEVRIPERWDREWIQKRKRRERERLGYCGPGDSERQISLPWPYLALKWGLKAIGLYARGQRNFRDVRLTTIEHPLSGWPQALDGYRILQVSDLHIDLDSSLMEPLCRCLERVEADLVVFTGDYWEGSHTDIGKALVGMQVLLDTIPAPADGYYGVLGNHDPVDLGAALEEKGIRILVNEAATIGTGGTTFALAGVDDPHYFKQDDVAAAAAQCPDDLPAILLSHSPQVAGEAAKADFDLMLSGHTHGGQVCLPGGHSIVKMAKVPWPLFRGSWQDGPLRGYTTTGAGACHVPVRFNCPPEIALHVIHLAPVIDENGSGGYSGG